MCSILFSVEKIEFIKSLTDITVTTIGTKATFECEISKDRARAQWLKDGIEIYPDRKYDISVSGFKHSLTINKVDSRDVGDYAIVVKGHRLVTVATYYNIP